MQCGIQQSSDVSGNLDSPSKVRLSGERSFLMLRSGHTRCGSTPKTRMSMGGGTEVAVRRRVLCIRDRAARNSQECMDTSTSIMSDLSSLRRP